jgi:energy-coupling factor transport system permease protein
MARRLSLYAHGATVLHRAHPFTKGVLVLVAIALAFLAPSLPWVLGLLALLLAPMAAARVMRRFAAVALVLLLPLTVILVVVQGLANPANVTRLLSVGPLWLGAEGMLAGLLAAARIACLTTVAFLFSFTTRPADLAEALMQRGLPASLGYVLQSTLQIIPQTLGSIDRIHDAQRTRGLESEGSLPRRARAYVPLLVPVILSSLVATQERAMALEVRGFGLSAPRHARYQLADSTGQRVLRWALLALVAVAIVARVLVWR